MDGWLTVEQTAKKKIIIKSLSLDHCDYHYIIIKSLSLFISLEIDSLYGL